MNRTAWTELRGVPACVVVVLAALAGPPAYAQKPTIESEILELLKQKRVLRCPVNLSRAGCGDETPSAPKAAAPVTGTHVRFAFASTALDDNARATLASFAGEVTKAGLSGRAFLVAGHTDATGRDAYNQRLSERRAQAVKRLLVEQFNLPPTALVAIGYGKTQLKNAADPFAGENRRVQIIETEQRPTASSRTR